MSTKVCSKCKIAKPLAEFASCRSKKDGLNCYCKPCGTAVSKEWYRRNKTRPEIHERLRSYAKDKAREFQQVVASIKTSLGCLLCGETEACCLDFHHVGGKEANISNLARLKTRKPLRNELMKCVCVCSNCHRKLHAGVVTPSTATIKLANDKLRVAVSESDFLSDRTKTRRTLYAKETELIYDETGLTKHYCSDCGKQVSQKGCKCRECGKPVQQTKIQWPSSHELLKMVEETSYVAVAKKIGVSDNAIRKRLKNHS